MKTRELTLRYKLSQLRQFVPGLIIIMITIILSFNYAKAQTTMSETKNNKIQLTIDKQELTATLTDSRTTRDFVDMLPLTLTLEDYASTEKISDLPKKLNTENAPAGYDPSEGDITYYAPWGNLAIFYKDFKYSNGLVILGHIDGSIGPLATSVSMLVKIELIK